MPASDECVVVCVDPARVAEIWPHVKLLLAQAYIGHFDDSIDAIEADVKSGASLLWIIWDGTGLLAAATVKIMQAPTRRVLRIECCAGREVHRWLHLIRSIEDFGRQSECSVCRIEGRKGWIKMLPDYREPYAVLEKDL